MNCPKISVIVPVYNVEEYIEETLNCLVNQTIIDEIEVLMIDDGSTDNSRYIIERFALDYDNFYAFHKENEGVAIARNFGIDISKGRYIKFLDSDDYIPPESCEKLYELAVKNYSDVVTSQFIRFSRYNYWENNLNKNCFKDITNNVDLTNLKNMPSLIWDTLVTNKLYKKEFLIKNNHHS